MTPAARPSRRIALLVERGHALRAPRECAWAELRVVEVAGEGGWPAAAARAGALGCELAIALAPADVDPASLSLAAPRRVVAYRTMPSALAASEALPVGTWITVPEPLDGPMPAAVLRVSPPAVDVGRVAAGPQLQRTAVLVPAWAAPPGDVLDALRATGEVDVAPPDLDLGALAERVARAGAVVHWSPGAAGRGDLVPLLALAAGALLVGRAPFPGGWEIEPNEEYVLAETPAAVLEAVARLRRDPATYALVRVRGWQRARDWFDASGALERIVRDLDLAAGEAAA